MWRDHLEYDIYSFISFFLLLLCVLFLESAHYNGTASFYALQ